MPDSIAPTAEVSIGTGTKPLLDRVLSFPVLLAALLVAKAFWTCRPSVADPDVWWHLRNAQVLLTTGHFPNIDTYAFATHGMPWLNHEWLPEVIFLYAFRLLALPGLFLATFLCAAALSVVVFLTCRIRTADPLAAGLAAIGGMLLAAIGFSPRPQLVGWLCFAGIYAILLLYRQHRTAKLWLIPLLFCLWINCHASWPFGFILFTIVIVAGLVREDIGSVAADPWSREQRKQLLVTLGASVAALFVNPFGHRLVWFPFRFVLEKRLNVGMVDEWVSVNFNDARGGYIMVVLAAVFLLAVAQRQRWRIDDVLLTLFVLYAGLTHVRMLLPAGIVLAPILAPQMTGISSYDAAHERRAINAALLAGVVAVFIFGFPRETMLRRQVATAFPVDAVTFLKQLPRESRIFNLWEWGGYLEWVYPERQTFIDSRGDLFEEKGVLADYLRISVLQNSQELLDRYSIEYVLYTPHTALAYFLQQSPAWQQVYRDNTAVVFRRVPSGKAHSPNQGN